MFHLTQTIEINLINFIDDRARLETATKLSIDEKHVKIHNENEMCVSK